VQRGGQVLQANVTDDHEVDVAFSDLFKARHGPEDKGDFDNVAEGRQGVAEQALQAPSAVNLLHRNDH